MASPRKAFLACLLLAMGSCRPDEPASKPSVANGLSGVLRSDYHDGELYFDERYLDSTDTEPESSWSNRTRREMAIQTQLRRLDMATLEGRDKPAKPNLTDSTFERVGRGPLIGYPNQAALLADIYRKIDSLKVLEHLPVTPHNPVYHSLNPDSYGK